MQWTAVEERVWQTNRWWKWHLEDKFLDDPTLGQPVEPPGHHIGWRALPPDDEPTDGVVAGVDQGGDRTSAPLWLFMEDVIAWAVPSTRHHVWDISVIRVALVTLNMVRMQPSMVSGRVLTLSMPSSAFPEGTFVVVFELLLAAASLCCWEDDTSSPWHRE
jgi:hypothetical protein